MATTVPFVVHDHAGRTPMPLIQISMLEGRTDEQKKALLAAVTDAVHTSIGASLPSIRVWINEFAPVDYMAEGVWHPERPGA